MSARVKSISSFLKADSTIGVAFRCVSVWLLVCDCVFVCVCVFICVFSSGWYGVSNALQDFLFPGQVPKGHISKQLSFLFSIKSH